MKRQYETVIGLEVHVELNTDTKIFCSCATTFGAEPNTLCCPVCAGLPGSMPTLNRLAVEKAITAGLALDCEIAEVCRMDRKQYFYPDLPKAYQISQDRDPICRNGSLMVSTKEGERRVGITRIHLEEDAGKLIHNGGATLVDCNRCGVPLIEIVSEPDLRSGEEAAEYVRELRRILLACGISDCRMQEGSLRCDVNLSVRPVGASTMGERTEIKNLNSFSFIEKAVRAETERQIRELETIGRVERQTVRFLPTEGKTQPMRRKESLAEYRFFPEPDLPPFRIDCETVERLRQNLPELPASVRRRLTERYGCSSSEAFVLTSREGAVAYYEEAVKQTVHGAVVRSLLLNELWQYCGDEPFTSPVSAERLGELAQLAGEGSVNRSVAKKLLARLLREDFSPRDVAEAEGLTQINDEVTIARWVDEVTESDPGSVSAYRGGKTNALRALQGKLMAKSGGRANPQTAERLLLERLERKGEDD